MTEKELKKHISALHINKMHGRMLSLPSLSSSKREILTLYGHHASIERMAGITQNLSKYGNITLPDLPGFGGMDSFYSIGLKPTIENYADYLASFIKLRFSKKRLSIIAVSYSFPIVTRMLQKYPELVKKVDILVSSVGFVHHDDFRIPMWQQYGVIVLGRVFEHSATAPIFRYTFLQGPAIRLSYKLVRARHSKMKDASDDEFNERINAEIKLWQQNDVRTRMKTMADMFNIDVCKKRVDLPVYHISVEHDRYFDNRIVEQHMRVIYSDFTDIPTIVPGHMPSIVATAEQAEPFVPKRLKDLLTNSK